MAASFHPQRMMRAMLMLGSFLAGSGLSFLPPDTQTANQEETNEMCSPCEIFFRKLEKKERSGKLSQVVRVQERGEPKSGTGFMFDWATGALMRTCNYLQRLYGRKSCLMEFQPDPENDGHLLPRPITRRMTFQPALGVRDAKCPCETIESVSIVLSKVYKHMLPVNSSTCAFSHNRGIDLARVQTSNLRDKAACKFADGTRQVKTHADLWRCMHEANCEITDDWLQMVVFRDPRPAVVSAFFHLQVQSDRDDVGTLEEFVSRELPIMCEWLALRFILFSGLLPHQSTEFWYSDAIADPLEWHYHWYDSVGLQLPSHVVSGAAKKAAENDLGFNHKKVDRHPGERPRADAGVRKFEDEVSPEVLKTADDILRVWLPPVILEKLGVAPTEIEV